MMIERVAETYDVEVDYTLLSDPDHRVIDRYGLFNPEEAKGRPVPHPTTYVIDMWGVIRWGVTELNYKLRPENVDIVEALRALD